MMICQGFKYPALMEHFKKISSIPRMSYHEDKIVAYLAEFAAARGLDCYVDAAKNVLIDLPSSACHIGEPLLLQGHTDMVCEMNIGSKHDFLNDGLELYEEDGYLKARETTLGADDGVAVAVMLALLDGAIEKHPACQCLFTSSEEVGLDGAKSFDYDRIFARKMLNMDAADEKHLIVGCAGGLRSDVFFDIKYVGAKTDRALKITIGGLLGGHSGENINDGRANANKLAGKMLEKLSQSVLFDLVSFDGGSKDNAIPREATVIISIDDIENAERVVENFESEIRNTLSEDDAGFFVSCDRCCGSDKVFEKTFTRNIIDFVNEVESGVLEMSRDIAGLVEFSRNLGIVKTGKEKIGFYFSSRSAKEEQLDASAEMIERAAAVRGGTVAHHSRYPGWNYTGSSELADKYIAIASERCGLNVERTVLHAGLECCIIKKAIPDMEIISCGPDIKDLHSPMERMDISSFERFFTIVSSLIEYI